MQKLDSFFYSKRLVVFLQDENLFKDCFSAWKNPVTRKTFSFDPKWYRLFFLVFVTAVYISQFWSSQRLDHMMCLFTFTVWGTTFAWSHYAVETLLAFGSQKMWIKKLATYLHTIAVTWETCVFLLFWCMLFPTFPKSGKDAPQNWPAIEWWSCICQHAVGPISIMIDFCFNGIPVSGWLWIPVILTILINFGLDALVSLVGGQGAVYKTVLTWRDVKTAGVFIGGIALFGIVYVCVYFLRKWQSGKLLADAKPSDIEEGVSADKDETAKTETPGDEIVFVKVRKSVDADL